MEAVTTLKVLRPRPDSDGGDKARTPAARARCGAGRGGAGGDDVRASAPRHPRFAGVWNRGNRESERDFHDPAAKDGRGTVFGVRRSIALRTAKWVWSRLCGRNRLPVPADAGLSGPSASRLVPQCRQLRDCKSAPIVQNQARIDRPVDKLTSIAPAPAGCLQSCFIPLAAPPCGGLQRYARVGR